MSLKWPNFDCERGETHFIAQAMNKDLKILGALRVVWFFKETVAEMDHFSLKVFKYLILSLGKFFFYLRSQSY